MAGTIMSKNKKAAAAIAAVSLLLVAYFVLAGFVFPPFYLSLVPQYPKPEVPIVKISSTTIPLGGSFDITVVGTNRGVTSDMQTLSISFPNMTSSRGIIVKSDNFTQEPVIIERGREIGSHYQGTQYPVYSKYPLVESYNRPWTGGTSHYATVSVSPESAGRFLILVKSVALPHSDIIHYPNTGVEDQQNEYALPYFVNVTKH